MKGDTRNKLYFQRAKTKGKLKKKKEKHNTRDFTQIVAKKTS